MEPHPKSRYQVLRFLLRPNRPSQSCSTCKTTNGRSLSVRPRRDTRNPRSFSNIGGSSSPHFAHSRRPSCRITLPRWPFLLHRRLNLRLSVGAAVDSQVRAGNIRRLRTSHKRDQRGDFVNRSVAVERCVGLLGHSPFASGGIQIRVDGILLTVMPRLPTSLDNP